MKNALIGEGQRGRQWLSRCCEDTCTVFARRHGRRQIDILPVLFPYRHSIEMQAKAVLLSGNRLMQQGCAGQDGRDLFAGFGRSRHRLGLAIGRHGAPRDQSLAELARGGESATVEFKSSLRWDVRESRVNKDLEKVVAKTIAGFLNVEGGVLLVGVADDGTVLGLGKDFETVLHKNRDGFQQHLAGVVSTFLRAEFVPYLRISFDDADGKTACIVRVSQSPRPVFLADRGEKEFYIRAGNTTRPLDMEAMHSYVAMHWET